jgi:hypothetical protein
VVRPKAKVLAGGPGKSVMNFSGCSVEVKDVVLSLYTNVDGKEVFLQRSYIDELGFRSDTRPLPDERDYNMSDVLSKAVKSYQIDNFGDVRVISLKRASEIRDEYEFFKYDDLTFEDNVFVSKDKGKNWLKVVYPFRIKYFDDSLGLRKFEDIIVDASIPRGSSEDVSLKIRRTYVSETGASMGVGEVEVCFRPKFEKRRFAFLAEQEDSFTFYGMCEDKLPDL